MEDSVIMPYSHIGRGAVIKRAIIAENVVVGEDAAIGGDTGDIAVVGNNTRVPKGHTLAAGQQMGI